MVTKHQSDCSVAHWDETVEIITSNYAKVCSRCMGKDETLVIGYFVMRSPIHDISFHASICVCILHVIHLPVYR